MGACSNREAAMLVAVCLVASSYLPMATSVPYTNSRNKDGDPCMTPQGVAGICRLVDKCPPLLALVAQRPSQESASLLNVLRCGFHGSVPVVCCTDGASESSKPTAIQGPTNSRPPMPTRPAPTHPSPTRPLVVQEDSTPPDVSRHPNLQLLPQDYCSPPGNDRIVNGKVADVFAYPWIARLGYLSRRSSWKPVAYHCGGTLINSRYVLTAAHCIKTKTDLYLATVKLGEHTIDKEIDCSVSGSCLPPPIDVDVEKTVVHPQYVSGVASHHDIALVRIARAVDFPREAFVRPICLPVSRENQNLRLDGGKLVAAGWGLTEDDVGSNALRDVLLAVIPLEQCKETFSRPGLQTDIIPQQLCAGGVDSKNSCNGDSGGPLMLEADVGTESKMVQFGIVSFGHNNCSTEGVPGVYTRVTFYVKWILDNMRP